MTDTDSKKISRRSLLLRSAAITGSALLHTSSHSHSRNNSRHPGRASSERGMPIADATLKRIPAEQYTESSTPLHQLQGIITPTDLHFERHHSSIPTILKNDYELVLHGMVDRSLKFNVQELTRFPAVSKICFIECAGNCYGYFSLPPETTAQTLAGLTSQSEWTGVALSALLKEAGVKSSAKWLLLEGSDAALMARSIPIDKAMEDAIVAYAQNGEPLRAEQGYPIRVVLPGWEGNTCVKWLRRIEVGDQPWMTRDETSKYTDPLKDNTIRQFSFLMDARSIITSPTYPEHLEKGWHEIRGLAWSGRGKIKQVEVSTDGGRNWQIAQLQQPVMEKSHTRFRIMWQWDGKERLLLSRAIDDTGYRQPWAKELIDVRGIGSLKYHNNAIIGWRIKTTGEIIYDIIA